MSNAYLNLIGGLSGDMLLSSLIDAGLDPEKLSKELKVDKCQFTNMELFKLSGWYIKLLGLADETFTTYHHLINLDK